MFSSILTDFRVTFRSLKKTPGFTFIAIATLALGIGANTAIFSVVNGILLKPLPYEDPQELVLVTARMNDGEIVGGGISGPDYRELERQMALADQVATMFAVNTNLVGENSAESVVLSWVTPNFFEMMGVSPRMGRTLTADDQVTLDPSLFQDGTVPPPLIGLLSSGAWERLYGNDPGVLGEIVRVNGQTIQIVGVMPTNFAIHMPPTVTMPTDFDVLTLWPFELGNMPPGPNGFTTVVARMRDGASIDQVQSELDGIAGRIREVSVAHETASYELDARSLHSEVVGPVKSALWVLLGTVGFVLLIACANVANLLLVKASKQQKEVAIRVALGSSRSAIVRRMLTESLVLTFSGAIVGLILAGWGIDLLLFLKPENLPRIDNVELNGSVLAFTLGVSVIAAGVFSIIPVIQSSNADPSKVLKNSVGSGAVGRHRIRNAITVVEVAVSVVLLIGAGLMMRSFAKLSSVDTGFEAENVLTFRFALPVFAYRSDEARSQVYRQLDAAFERIPGVISVGAVTPLPLSEAQWDTRSNYAIVPGEPAQEDLYEANYHPASPGFFEAMSINVVSGRVFSEIDNLGTSSPVVVIDQKLAERHWPDQDPVGQPLTIFLNSSAFSETPAVSATIIGVVDNVRFTGLAGEERESLYFPHSYTGVWTHDFAVKTAGDPRAIIPDIRQTVRDVAADVPVDDFKLMEDYVEGARAQTRFVMVMLGTFSGVALVMAVVGLYGVISFGVRQRTHELGVRIALGASHGRIVTMVLGQGLRLTVAGAGIGIGLSIAMNRVLTNLLFGVTGVDPITYLAIGGLLVAVAAGATFFPARKAALVPPGQVLRSD